MLNIFSKTKQSSLDDNLLSEKVNCALIDHVYSQAYLALIASFFCATIVLLGLLPTLSVSKALWIWFSFYCAITILRFVLIYFYKKSSPFAHQQYFNTWNALFVLGSALAGFSWGLSGIILLPIASPEQRILMILMLAGVTGGSVPISAAMLTAAICFLIFSLVPYIAVILSFGTTTYLLFDLGLTVYLFYSIGICFKANQLIRNSILLRFDNDSLVKNLFEAKQQLETTNKALEHTATHDSLTQAANRSLFSNNLENAIKRAQADKNQIALLYMDLDRFKLVNDAYGHAVGDQLLIRVIDKLKGFLKQNSFVARLGGDEITIILEGVEDIDEVSLVADQICQLIAVPVRIDRIDLKVSASIGISMYPTDGTDVSDLLWQADKAMYHVKEHGGNHYAFFSEINEANTEKT